MWIREIEVNAGGKTLTNQGDDAVHIEFDIPFSDKKEPDVSEIDIWNLSDSSINQIRADGYIYVNAGYRDLGNIGNILTGEVEEILPEWQGVDKLTKILVSDGGKKWRDVVVNKTYAEGTKASFIMRDLANALSYEIVAIEPVEDKVYDRGYSVKGKAADSLRTLVNDTKSKMFINKNRLVIRDKDIGYELGFTLDSSSGLIGSPVQEVEEKEENGKKSRIVRWRVTSLLNPLFETDGIIQVDSKLLKGKFRIVEGVHTRDFNTELLVEEAK